MAASYWHETDPIDVRFFAAAGGMADMRRLIDPG
jgi:hypothetical protein